MASQRISPEVRAFVAAHIHSVTQLELLLLLHRDPGVKWTARRAAAEMRLPEQWVADHLERFAGAGLISISRSPEAAFRYRSDGERAVVVDELAETYRRRRTSVTSLIFTPATDEIRLLSDAFRIRRQEEDD